MSKIHLLSPDERQIFMAEAAANLGIPFSIIEKDFWVVWTLERLFSLDELKTHLTFKGGTSLSKIFGIIDRFSEDIDVSIEKHFLGFSEENDPEKAESKKKQRAAVEDLARSCSTYVQNKMLGDLKKILQKTWARPRVGNCLWIPKILTVRRCNLNTLISPQEAAIFSNQ